MSPTPETVWSPRSKYLVHNSRLLIIVAVLAATSYSTFPLAYFLNPAYFWRGLVSGLAEPGQPYYWLFAAFDTLGALLGVALFGYLYYRSRHAGKLYQGVLVLAIAASLSEFITDVAALPQGYNTNTLPTFHALITHPVVLIHGAASLLNSCAFIGSLGLWAYVARRNKQGSLARVGLFAVSIGIGTIGSAVGFAYPASSASLQRMFILSYSIWIFILAQYAVRQLPNHAFDKFSADMVRSDNQVLPSN